jgi:hypothetical protein
VGLKTVFCATCGSKHEPLFDDAGTQAMGCASNIFERDGQRYAIGHYGSRIIDGHLYKVLTNSYIKGIICDQCVQKGIDENHFDLINKNNYFGIDL